MSNYQYTGGVGAALARALSGAGAGYEEGVDDRMKRAQEQATTDQTQAQTVNTQNTQQNQEATEALGLVKEFNISPFEAMNHVKSMHGEPTLPRPPGPPPPGPQGPPPLIPSVDTSNVGKYGLAGLGAGVGGTQAPFTVPPRPVPALPPIPPSVPPPGGSMSIPPPAPAPWSTPTLSKPVPPGVDPNSIMGFDQSMRQALPPVTDASVGYKPPLPIPPSVPPPGGSMSVPPPPMPPAPGPVPPPPLTFMGKPIVAGNGMPPPATGPDSPGWVPPPGPAPYDSTQKLGNSRTQDTAVNVWGKHAEIAATRNDPANRKEYDYTLTNMGPLPTDSEQGTLQKWNEQRARAATFPEPYRTEYLAQLADAPIMGTNRDASRSQQVADLGQHYQDLDATTKEQVDNDVNVLTPAKVAEINAMASYTKTKDGQFVATAQSQDDMRKATADYLTQKTGQVVPESVARIALEQAQGAAATSGAASKQEDSDTKLFEAKIRNMLANSKVSLDEQTFNQIKEKDPVFRDNVAIMNGAMRDYVAASKLSNHDDKAAAQAQASEIYRRVSPLVIARAAASKNAGGSSTYQRPAAVAAPAPNPYAGMTPQQAAAAALAKRRAGQQ